jgi:hypothetical protein
MIIRSEQRQAERLFWFGGILEDDWIRVWFSNNTLVRVASAFHCLYIIDRTVSVADEELLVKVIPGTMVFTLYDKYFEF